MVDDQWMDGETVKKKKKKDSSHYLYSEVFKSCLPRK